MGKCRKNYDHPGQPSGECRGCPYYRGKRRGCSLFEIGRDKPDKIRRRERAALKEAKRMDRDAGRDE